jgi:hypothetical protein
MSRNLFDGVAVFSATKFMDRDKLGDRVTAWLRSQRGREVVRTVVTQSSDAEFHCIAMIVFWREASEAASRESNATVHQAGEREAAPVEVGGGREAEE